MAVRVTRSLKSRRWAGYRPSRILWSRSSEMPMNASPGGLPSSSPGPATPVMPTPTVAPERSRAASAMAMAHSPETAPYFSMMSAGTPIAIFHLVCVGNVGGAEVGGGAGGIGEDVGEVAAGAGFHRRNAQAALGVDALNDGLKRVRVLTPEVGGKGGH